MQHRAPFVVVSKVVDKCRRSKRQVEVSREVVEGSASSANSHGMSTSSLRTFSSAVLVATLSMLASPLAHAQDSVSAPLVGADDRRNWYELDPELQSLVQRSTVALARPHDIDPIPGSSEARIDSVYRADHRPYCAGSAYECEEIFAYCSGTLIDGDTVITAGHCFTAAELDGSVPCNNTAVVFNFRMEAEGRRAPILHDRDVYYCHEILAARAPSCPVRGRSAGCSGPGDTSCGAGATCQPSLLAGSTAHFCRCDASDPAAAEAWCRAEGDATATCDVATDGVTSCNTHCTEPISNDFAIFRIKRDRAGTAPTPVSAPYAPVAVSRTRPMPHATPIWTIGHGSGLPVKVSPDAIIAEAAVGFASLPNNQRRLTPQWMNADGHPDRHFYSHADTLGGNSGGGTFVRDASGYAIAGILVAGWGSSCLEQHLNPFNAPPYGHCRDTANSCIREDFVTPSPRAGSIHVWADYAVDTLCAAGTPHSLCGTAPPVAPGAYVPSPAPREPGGGGSAGCSSAGDAQGGAWLLLALVAWGLRSRRRERRGTLGATSLVALALFVTLGGCKAGMSETEVDAGVDADRPMPPELADVRYSHRYVATAVLPRVRTGEVGLDLDGDGTIDNALGELTTALHSAGFDLNAVLYDSIVRGRWVVLGRFEMDGEGQGALRVYRGATGVSPDPSGDGFHRVEGTSSVAVLRGTYAPSFDAELSAESATLWAPLPSGEVALPLREVRARGAMTSLRTSMQLGGLLTVDDLNVLLGALVREFGDDPRLASLDADGDGEVTPLELRDHPVIGPLLRPDVDLDGDGTADHFSVGVRIDWVRAAFDTPELTDDRDTRRTKSGDAGVSRGAMCEPDPCEDATDCAACNARPECGFCSTELGCVLRTREAECTMDGGAWADRVTECVDCASRATCGECVGRNAFCAWCPGMGCVSDTAGAALACGADYRRFTDGCE